MATPATNNESPQSSDYSELTAVGIDSVELELPNKYFQLPRIS